MLMLTDYFPKPTLPAMGVWALQQARGLAAAGAEVRVISPTSWIPPLLRKFPAARRFHDCPPAHQWDGIRVIYPRWPFYSFSRVRRLWFGRPRFYCRFAGRFLQTAIDDEIRDYQPDVVFAHHSIPCGILAMEIRHRHGVPFIVQDFDFNSIESCRSLPRRRKAFEQVARASAAMIGASSRICRGVSEICPGVKTAPLYTGTHRLPADIRDAPRPADIAGKIVVFSAAVMYERKGIPLLIRAFAQVAKVHPNLVLRLAGDGEERGAVDAAIAEANLGDRIQMLGLVPHDRILQEMVWSDLFMLVGWDEPFATVFLEAMSAGKPIICCDDGGICEVMQDGVHGLTVPPRNQAAAAAALNRLVSDPVLCRRLGKASGELFEQRLTLEASAASALKILHEAAAAREAAAMV